MNNLNPSSRCYALVRQLAFLSKGLLFSIIFFFFFIQTSTAQAPDQFSYQGVVRDLSNNLITNTTLGVQITILQGSASGSNLFRETHTPVTNDAGLFSIEIGTGTNVNGSLSAINWEMGPFFIEQAIDPMGGTNYTITGTTQLLSVPYALYAKNAGRAASAAVADEASTLAASGAASLTVPLGTILPYAGNAGSVPSGWLLCDGTSYDVNEYPALFNLINTTYGAEPGRFRVPNLQGRVPVGYNVNQVEFDNLGEFGGERTHTLDLSEIPSHNHNGTTDPDGEHGHDVVTNLNPSLDPPVHVSVKMGDGSGNSFDEIDSGGGDPGGLNVETDIEGDHTHSFTTSSVGEGMPHNNLQPYLTINYIIKAE